MKFREEELAEEVIRGEETLKRLSKVLDEELENCLTWLKDTRREKQLTLEALKRIKEDKQ